MFEFHPANPHDHFFRRTFDVLPNARALLKSQLPAELVAKLDLQSIQPAKETFLTATDNESRLDLLFTARLLDGTSLLIYLLLEHKSWVDRRIALQLLKYVLRIQEWRDRNGQPPCVVIPLVVYQGTQQWDEPTSLRHKVNADQDLQGFVPDMQVILVDLGGVKSSFLPELPELEARIRAMQIARRPELPYQSTVAIFELLQGWEKSDSQNDALNDIVVYLCSVFDAKNLHWLTQAFRAGQAPGSGKLMPNCLEALFEKGVKQGVQQGVEQGIEQGLTQGKVVGSIQTMQRMLNLPITPEPELLSRSLDELWAIAAQLESSARKS
ncbi:MAG: Rpn family recombination-promoting nuclease/putative transposase [Planctomyces sp.]